MKALVAILLAGQLTACGFLPDATPPPDECWFAQGVPIGVQQRTTLGDVGMGGPTGEWNAVQVYVRITADPVDLWDTGQMSRRSAPRSMPENWARRFAARLVPSSGTPGLRDRCRLGATTIPSGRPGPEAKT